MRATRLAPLATTLLLVTLGVTACSDDTPTQPGTSEGFTPSAEANPSESASDNTSPSTSESASATDPQTIDITFEGDTVTPNGDRVSVPLGEEVDLVVTADRPGELHVHSTPEQEVAFQHGDTEAELSFDQPGVVDVEDHATGKVIVQLQVS